jgi:hypothetical protein
VCYALLQRTTSITFYFIILNFVILNLVDCCVVVMHAYGRTYVLCNFFIFFSLFSTSYLSSYSKQLAKCHKVNHLFFTSNPPEKLGCQTRSCLAGPGNIRASANVVNTSEQPTVALKSLPMQLKSSKKKKIKGDNVAMLSSPASATTSTSTALLPLVPNENRLFPCQKR